MSGKAVDSVVRPVEDLRVSDGVSPASDGRATNEAADNLCERCQNLDILGILGNYRKVKDSFGECIITDLGSAESMKQSDCQLCQFFHSMILEKPTDKTCYCNSDRLHHTFPSFKTKNFQLRAMIVGHAYLGQEVAKGVRQDVTGLQKQVLLGIAPGTRSSESWRIAYHCWYRTGMIAASTISPGLGSSTGTTKRWNLQTRQISPERVSYDMLIAWLGICKDNHEKHCDHTFQNEAPCAKVIDCKTGEIIRTPQNCEYITLSYVWGQSAIPSPGPVKRAKGNAMVLAIPDSLPLTVRDAMEVVRRLGFQYLWVDKYCIDQEDLEEKMSQILCMDLIYAHCNVVIVAAAGKDPSFGLPGVSTRSRTPQPTITTKGVKLCSTLPNPVYTVRRSTWMTRGWTYQEAIFPKRRLYFTEHQVVFECNETLFTEVFSHPPEVEIGQYQHDKSIFVSTDIDECANPMVLRWTISSHIEAFSSRNVTNESDALLAFLGVFQRLQRLKVPVCQFLGLPIQNSATLPDRSEKPHDNDGESTEEEEESTQEEESRANLIPTYLGPSGVLASALHWYHIPASATEMNAIKRRPVFPSWTWLGWTNQVMWSLDLPSDETNDIEIDVEDKEGRLWPWDSWHNAEEIMRNQESMSGRLRVRGWLVQAQITSMFGGSRREFFALPQGRHGVELYVSLGTASPPSSLPDDNKQDSSELYLRLLDETITWELLSLGSSEALMLLKDEGNGQFSRLGTTQKSAQNREKSAGQTGCSYQRRVELWLI